MEASHLESLYPATTREAEVAHVLAYVKEGNSCQIVGIPGVGRSNLTRLLSYNRSVRLKHLGENQKWFHFVLVDFAEIRRKPLLEVTKFLFLELVDSLRERKMHEEYASANEILKESLGFHDEMVLFQGLKRAVDLLAIEKELTIVFLFDRFDTYIPTLESDFFSQLRILRNRAKYRFSVVFSLSRPLEDMVEAALFADFHEFVAGHVVYLPIMDEPGLAFRMSYLEKTTGKKIDDKAKKDILRLTAGHGKLTRLSIEAWLSKGGTGEIAPFLMDQTTVRGALWEIWHALRPEEQQYLESGSRNKELGTALSIPYLEQVGLIRENKITIVLFETFVREADRAKKDLAEAKEGKLGFKPETSDILQGELVITDKFTAAEYKLLCFFLQNPDRIVSREEMIQAVWGDAKSTAGVTDQAIDQLVFRLRRKVEDDPNNPHHLQTIKGRGFRFIS